MRPFSALRSTLLPFLAPVLLAGAALPASASSGACASDGQPPPRVLVERFLSADCERCWADAPAAMPGDSAALLDWIVPGRQGDDAPLSAAATRDALERLDALRRTPPTATDTAVTDVLTAARAGRTAGRLRVGMGPPLNDYVGATIAFTPSRTNTALRTARPGAPLAFTLVLVETVPEGAEGNAAERHIVRNALQGTWTADASHRKTGWSELRPMRIPDGARVERLGVVGWVQDAGGNVVAAARARCVAGTVGGSTDK